RVTPQTRSLASAVIVRKTGTEAVPSLTCRDFRRSDLSLVPSLFKKGLDNFLVVFGDPYPGHRIEDYDFRKTEDLIRGVQSTFDGQHPCIGAVTNQYAKDQERETSRTLRKVEAGADYIVTNTAFDDKSGVRDNIVCSSLYLAERSRSLSFLVLGILVRNSPDAGVLTIES